MKPYFEQGDVTIYCADMRDVLATLPKAHHIITDPPYDKKTHKGARTAKRDASDHYDPQHRAILMDFDPLDIEKTLHALLGCTQRWFVAFCALEMLGEYARVGGVNCWVRSGFWRRIDGAPQFSGDRPAQPGEGIAILHAPLPAPEPGKRKPRRRWNGGGHHAYWEALTVKRDRLHPAQKPETLMAALVADFTDPGELVLDPFMGSGTTLVACQRLGRRVIGIEEQEKYCEVAAKRLAQRALPMNELPAELRF